MRENEKERVDCEGVGFVKSMDYVKVKFYFSGIRDKVVDFCVF